MNVLICGTGSIASRHYNNLLKLGFKNITFYKATKNKIHNSINVKKNKFIYSLNNIEKFKFKLALICNETSKHYKVSEKLAKLKCNLFIEKPVSDNSKEIAKLIKLQKKYKIKVAVGFMSRFHPLVDEIRKLVKTNYNKIYYVRCHWGEYFPDWHPYENYKTSYVVKKNLGGGVALTLCHEIDLLIYLFGKIVKLNKLKLTNNILKIETDNIAEYQIQFKKKIISNIHLNLLQKPKQRTMEIFLKNGKLHLDLNNHILTIYNNLGKAKTKILHKFERNDMFLKELKCFINYIRFNRRYSKIPTLQQSLYLNSHI